MAVGLALALPAAPAAADIGTMHIGSKNFSGAEVLSQLYGQALAAKGAQITFRPDIGPTEATFAQLQQGAFDAYGEYQGTLLEFLGGTPTQQHQAHARRARSEAARAAGSSSASPRRPSTSTAST